jgi:hypothetical protein
MGGECLRKYGHTARLILLWKCTSQAFSVRGMNEGERGVEQDEGRGDLRSHKDPHLAGIAVCILEWRCR